MPQRIARTWPRTLPVERYEQIGVDNTNTRGTAVATSASLNTKGSYVQLKAATDRRVSGLYVTLQNLSASVVGYLVDIAVGGAGSEQVVIANVFMITGGGNSYQSTVFIPVSIPAGTRISARAQATAGSQTIYVMAVGFSETLEAPILPGNVVSYGPDIVNSVSEFVQSGSANVEGSWKQYSASTSRRIRSLSIVINPNSSGDWIGLLDVGVGGSGSEVAVIEGIPISNEGAADRQNMVNPWLPVDIPAGTRLSMRMQTNPGSLTIYSAIYAAS